MPTSHKSTFMQLSLSFIVHGIELHHGFNRRHPRHARTSSAPALEDNHRLTSSASNGCATPCGFPATAADVQHAALLLAGEPELVPPLRVLPVPQTEGIYTQGCHVHCPPLAHSSDTGSHKSSKSQHRIGIACGCSPRSAPRHGRSQALGSVSMTELLPYEAWQRPLLTAALAEEPGTAGMSNPAET